MAATVAVRQSAQTQHSELQRRVAGPAPRGRGPVRAGISRLQRAAGNSAMSRRLSSGTIQAKLTVGRDDDDEYVHDRLGNMTLQAPLHERRVQAKRTVSQPADRWEQEADRVAAAVVAGRSPRDVQRVC